MEPFTAIVLAGGASARMGRPKALLPFGAETLIERVVRRLEPIASEVVVVSGPHLVLPALRNARVIEDEKPLQGPVAGILYGLRAARTDLGFVCGCDHPFLEPAVVRLLIERSAAARGAVAVFGGIPQPLVGAYRQSVAEIAASMLAAGERRAAALVRQGGLVEVPEEDLLRIDPYGRGFLDVDTPEAYKRALELISLRVSQ
jgi:molybdopterin-guanine dinucleotide biosynthesis protein A